MTRSRERNARMRLAAALAGAAILGPAPAAGVDLEAVRTLASQERLAAARAAFDALPTATRRALGARLLHGVLKAREGALDEATVVFEEIVRTHPERPEARINLARLDAARWGSPDARARLVDDRIEGEHRRANAWRVLRELYSRLTVLAYSRSNAVELGLVRDETAAGPPPVAPLRTPFSRVFPPGTPPVSPGGSERGREFARTGSGRPDSSPVLPLRDGGLDVRDAPAAVAVGNDATRFADRTVGVEGAADANRPAPRYEGGASTRAAPARRETSESRHPAGAAPEARGAAANAPVPNLDAAGDGLSAAPAASVAGLAPGSLGGKTRPAPEGPGALVTLEGSTAYAPHGPATASTPDVHASSWHALLRALALAVSAVAGLGAIAGGVAILIRGRGPDRSLRRRLERVAAPLAGPAILDGPTDEESIFRSTEKRSRLFGLRDRIEARYPLLRIRQAVPASLGAAVAGAGGCWFSMWFLKVSSGWWSAPLVGAAGAGAAWYALAWLQSRREAEFIRQFPEVVDQVVRLAGAGLPPLEAVSAVAEDTPDPIKPVLGGVRDGLLAGLDADSTLRAASDRVQVGEFTLFAAVIRLQRRAGGGISSAFSNLAETLRERRKTALRAHASTAQSRLTLLVLVVMPIVVLVAQNFIAPESIEMLFNTETGLSLLRWGVALVVAGILVARSIAARAVR